LCRLGSKEGRREGRKERTKEGRKGRRKQGRKKVTEMYVGGGVCVCVCVSGEFPRGGVQKDL